MTHVQWVACGWWSRCLTERACIVGKAIQYSSSVEWAIYHVSFTVALKQTILAVSVWGCFSTASPLRNAYIAAFQQLPITGHCLVVLSLCGISQLGSWYLPAILIFLAFIFLHGRIAELSSHCTNLPVWIDCAHSCLSYNSNIKLASSQTYIINVHQDISLLWTW